ncbi:unnamed protein product, partial [Prorocentrum cordatum]
ELACDVWRPTWQRRLPARPAPPPLHSSAERRVVAARALVQALEGACGWLRLNGHFLRLHDGGLHNRKGRAVAVGTLRFHVRGLPTARRAKWVMPLILAIVPLLKDRGHDVFIQTRELFATMEDGALIKIELCASRFE